MFKTSILIVLLLLFISSYAQVPSEINGINYQGIARDADGEVLAGETIDITFTIEGNGESYIETHNSKVTNNFGLFTLIIGEGNLISSTKPFEEMWKFANEINVSADINGTSVNFDPIKIAAVPYSFKAKYEGQEINYNSANNYLRISDGTKLANGLPKYIDSTLIATGNGTSLPTGGASGQVLSTDGSGNYSWVTTSSTNTDNQQLSITGNVISLDNSTDITLPPDLVDDADNSPFNEIELPPTAITNQVLTWNGSAWVAQNSSSGGDNWGTQTVISDATITGNGSTVPLSGFDGDFTSLTSIPTNIINDPNDELQDISLTGTNLSITNGSTVPLSSFLDNTDSQILSYSAGSIAISGGNSITLPTSSDNQQLSLTSNALSLTNGGTAIDLSSYLDNTDNQIVDTLELQTGNILAISLSGDNAPKKTIDLSSLLAAGSDKDWIKAGSTDDIPSNNTDDIYTLGNVGIGMNNPGNSKINIYDADVTENTSLKISKTINNNNQSGISIFTTGSIINQLSWGLKVNKSIIATSNSSVRGIESNISISGSGSEGFASYNVVQGNNNNNKTGVYSKADGSDGVKIGLWAFTEGASGSHIGVYSEVGTSSTSTSDLNYGFKFENNAPAISGKMTYGIHNSGENYNYFSGSLGIGNLSPSAKLEVHTNSASTDPIFAGLNATNPYFNVKGSGYVGIGTSTPVQQLHISGRYTAGADSYNNNGDGMAGTYIDLQNKFGSSTSRAKVGIRFKNSTQADGQHTKGAIVYQRSATNARGDLYFLNNSTDDISEVTIENDSKMVIKNNGLVYIGGPSLSPTLSSAKLEVNGSINLIGPSSDNNELNRTPTGAAHLAPIAYANVSSTGVTNTSSNNVTVSKLTTGQYRVNITSETLNVSNCIISINTQNSNPRFTGYGASGGGINVYIRDLNGNFIDNSFSISIFKP